MRRDVHSVCSWDEKAAVRIQEALRNEILRFISEAQGVSQLITCVGGGLKGLNNYAPAVYLIEWNFRKGIYFFATISV